MLKQSIIYLILSILVVVFASYVHLLLIYIDLAYVFINIKLAPLLSRISFGPMLRKTLLLVLIPATIAAIPALCYRFIKGKNMPYFIASTWCIWLVLLLSSILIHY